MNRRNTFCLAPEESDQAWPKSKALINRTELNTRGAQNFCMFFLSFNALLLCLCLFLSASFFFNPPSLLPWNAISSYIYTCIYNFLQWFDRETWKPYRTPESKGHHLIRKLWNQLKLELFHWGGKKQKLMNLKEILSYIFEISILKFNQWRNLVFFFGNYDRFRQTKRRLNKIRKKTEKLISICSYI
jgi:hypothetical protein